MLKEQVLYYLEQDRARMRTGGDLARQLGVSRTAIWKAVHTLLEEGNAIEVIPNSGYRLLPESDGLCGYSVQDRLTTERIGRSLEILPSAESTNQYLKSLDTVSLCDGHVVIADEQTGGRGRMGRPFFSPKGQGLYMSVFLRPMISPWEVQALTLCAAVAVSKAIEILCNIKPDIKWVNDLCVNGKKLCGILTEASVSAEMQVVDSLIVGIGINTGEVSKSVADIATSVQEATGMRGIRNRLAAEVLNQLEQTVLDYTVHSKREEILAAYCERMPLCGKEVCISQGNTQIRAVVTGVDESGGLIALVDDGEEIVVNSGEIWPARPGRSQIDKDGI